MREKQLCDEVEMRENGAGPVQSQRQQRVLSPACSAVIISCGRPLASRATFVPSCMGSVWQPKPPLLKVLGFISISSCGYWGGSKRGRVCS